MTIEQSVIVPSALIPTSARFRSISEGYPGAKLERLWQELAPAYRRWYLRDGKENRPSYAKSLTMLRSHMPELLPTFEQLLARCAADELTARFLTLYDSLADSRIRENFIATRQQDRKQTYSHFLQLFLQPPLYRTADQSRGWGTLYTAAYYPTQGYMEILWPNGHWQQSFENFIEQERTVVYPSVA